MYTNKPKLIYRMLERKTRERLTIDDVSDIIDFFDGAENDKAGIEFTEKAFSFWVVGKNYTELLTDYANEHSDYLLNEAEEMTKDYLGEYDDEEYESREEYNNMYNEELEDNCKRIVEKEGYVLSPCKGRLLFLSFGCYANIY